MVLFWAWPDPSLPAPFHEPHTLIFVDKTGSDRRTSLRRYSYSLKGKPATTDTLLVRGRRYSAIAAMGLDGIVGCAHHQWEC